MRVLRSLVAKLANAIEEFALRSLTRKMGRSKAAWFVEKARTELDKARWKDAAFFARVAIGSDPTLPSGYLLLAFAYMRSGDHTRVREVLREGSSIAPEDPRFAAYLGDLEWDLGHWIEAEEAYRRAIALQGGKLVDSNWMLNLALAVRQLGREDEAISLLEDLRQTDPGFTRGIRALAAVHIQRNDYTRAVSLLRETVEREPSLAAAHYDLAYALASLSKWEEALEEARKAVQLDPEDVDSRRLLRAVESRT